MLTVDDAGRSPLLSSLVATRIIGTDGALVLNSGNHYIRVKNLIRDIILGI